MSRAVSKPRGPRGVASRSKAIPWHQDLPYWKARLDCSISGARTGPPSYAWNLAQGSPCKPLTQPFRQVDGKQIGSAGISGNERDPGLNETVGALTERMDFLRCGCTLLSGPVELCQL